MNSTAARHPEQEQLLRYADGELSPREARRVRGHLEACWQCRTELEEIQGVVGECVRYRKEVLQVHLPPPPAPWADLTPHFDRIDARRPPLMERLAAALAWPARSPRRWAMAGVAVALVFVLVYELRETPSVHAAALLRKAVAAEETRPRAPRRLRIRTRKQQVVRVAARTPELSEVEALFRAARYDWSDPLSPRSFQAWRDSLAEKRDEVITSPDAYRLRTETPGGELAAASLTLSAAGLRPMEGRFEFRNQEWVEISELPEPAPAPEVAAATPPPVPEPVRAPEVEHFASIRDELQVVAALHGLGADLGEPIEVTRDGARIVVSGVGIAEARRQQIHQALDRIPRVVVRFSDPPTAAGETSEAGAPDRPQVAGNALHARLEEYAGGRVQFERLSAQVLDLSEAMMSRAYALRRLAQRFPPAAERELNAPDRVLLGSLVREHAVALDREAARIHSALAPVLTSLGGTAPGLAPVPAVSPWQAGTENVFRAARHAESLLAVMLGAAPGDSADLPSEVLAAVARLRASAGGFASATLREAGAGEK
ncbi:MAG: zf-HC2 domain-containing protein [Bryobacteraceae bacterium]